MTKTLSQDAIRHGLDVVVRHSNMFSFHTITGRMRGGSKLNRELYRVCANPPSRVTWQCRECFVCIDADREDDPFDFGWRQGRCPECSETQPADVSETRHNQSERP